MKKGRIIYLSYDGMTDPLGQSQVLPYLKGLSELGFSITLVSFEKPESFAKNKSLIEQISRQYAIDWNPLPYHKKPPVLSTLYDIWLLKKIVKKLHQKKSFHIVHCRGYITALVGEWMKKKWRVKFLFDMRGFFADERVDGGIWPLKHPLYKRVYQYFKRKEKDFFLHADHVISLTEAGKKIIQQFDYIPSHWKCTVIPCCADLDHFNIKNIDAESAAKFNGKYNLQRFKQKWFYLGSIGSWYMLPEMLDFFKIVLRHEPQSLMAFFTHEPSAIIYSLAEKKQIPKENIIVTSLQRNEIPSILSLFDASVFFIKPVFSKKASSPTKQGEIMAMGIPIVCNSGVGDTEEIIQTYEAGAVIHNFNSEAYEVAYHQIIHGKFNRKKSMEGACAWYSLKIGIERYASVYRELLNHEAS
ncbi:MAG: glycosyltransferase [Flavobacteriales bacterium]|nr:glycosyltransferase [Flavobacteriales bacterium]